ncbi:MAG: AAA family ATPase [Chloroflexi bacterium]|nr:AAA family ATPase [Chloroflexota bacterium]
MADDAHSLDKEAIRTAIAELEAQRSLLSGAVVESALAALRRQLAEAESLPALHTPEETGVERRIVTVMFTDIVGSTALTESLDPEEWRELVAEIHTVSSQHVVAHSGTVVQYLGDGLLALFGAHETDEHDAENAIRAALEIRSSMAARTSAPAVKLRIGIHTGLVVLGELGTEVKREFTASGNAMNLAARIQSAAPAGHILISHDTYRYVRGIFQLAPQPLLTMKGQSNPVQTYLVQRAETRPFGAINRGVDGVRTPTIGREVELGQLNTYMMDALDRGSVVWALLVGEAGVGKSRLLSEVRAALAKLDRPIFMLKARAFQDDEKYAYSLVRRMWFDRFNITEDAPLGEAESQWVDQFLKLHATKDDDAALALGLLVGLQYEQHPQIKALREDPAQLKGRAWVVSRALFTAIQQTMPIVVLLEDLQWADPSSIEYLTAMLLQRESPGHGIYVLATARPGWTNRGLLEPRDGYRQIDLQTLSTPACLEFVAALLQDVAGVTDDVIRMIAQRSEGNPYYVEEIINWCLDRGIIERSEDRRRFIAERLRETALPATLQHLLLTRIGALHESERRVLQYAAVFGRNFWESGIEIMGAGSAGQVLSRLEQRGLIELQATSSFANDREWSFHHQLLRDATYESLLKSERRRLHKYAAAWLESIAGQSGRLDEFVNQIGEHTERSGDVDMAVVWFLRAGERARMRGATAEARKYYERVLDLAHADDLTRRWPALLGLSDVLRVLGDTAAYQATVDDLLSHANRLDDAHLAEALYRKGFYYDFTGDYQAAVRAYRAGAESAHNAGQPVLEATMLALSAICLNRLNDEKIASSIAERVLQLSQQLGRSAVVKALSNLAVYYSEAGDIARAAELHAELAGINHQLGDRAAEANASGNLGYDYVCLGQYTAGGNALESSIVLSESIGARRELVYSKLNLTMAQWRSGRRQLAQQTLDKLDQELSALGDPFARAAGLSYRGLIDENMQDYDKAIVCYREAARVLESLGVGGYAIDAQAGEGRCALGMNRLQDAAALAGLIWGYLSEHGTAGMEFPIWNYMACAEIFKAAGQVDRFRTVIQAGYDELARRASRISKPEWRRTYLDNVPEHKALLDLYAGVH